MIDIKSLTKDHKGCLVLYRAKEGLKREKGIISSWNEKFIFIRYTEGDTAEATFPGDLEFVKK